MSGMPLQTGDSAVEGTGSTEEMIGRQRANKRFLETLEETTELHVQLRDILAMNICFYEMIMMMHTYLARME